MSGNIVDMEEDLLLSHLGLAADNLEPNQEQILVTLRAPPSPPLSSIHQPVAPFRFQNSDDNWYFNVHCALYGILVRKVIQAISMVRYGTGIPNSSETCLCLLTAQCKSIFTPPPPPFRLSALMTDCLFPNCRRTPSHKTVSTLTTMKGKIFRVAEFLISVLPVPSFCSFTRPTANSKIRIRNCCTDPDPPFNKQKINKLISAVYR